MDRGDELFASKYRMGDLLGEGGMGEVYAAENVYSGARVAIKLVPKEKADPRLYERLQGEARALARLEHENIVRLLDVGPTAEGGLYIAMELVEGKTLRTLIRVAKKKGKLLDLDLVLPAIAQCAEAMELAHSEGVYHRDLKPENIMVKPGGRVKVLDFGLAKAPNAGRAAGVNPTNPASVVGTPRYMAPEQVRGQAIDARSDIYGLGVVLYEAVSGRTPYDMHEDAATTDTELMGYHVFAAPTPIREHVPTCPDRLWNIIVRCLAKDPADRYQDMKSLAVDLRATLAEMVAEPSPRAAKAPAAVAPRRAEPSSSTTRSVQTAPGPREVRETEPMPPAFAPGAALPFAPRGVRETQPLPAAFAPGAALPFAGASQRPKLGKGYTQPLPSAATLLARRAAAPPAEAPARHALPPPPSVPPPGVPPPATGEGRGGATRSGPSFAFDPTSPGPPPADLNVVVVPGGWKHIRMKLSLILVLPLALVLAGLIVGAWSAIRARRDAEPWASVPAEIAPPVSTPSATASAAPESTATAPPPVPPPPATAAPTSTASAVSEPSATVPPPSPAVTMSVPSSRPSAVPTVRKSPEPKKPAPKPPEPKKRERFVVE